MPKCDKLVIEIRTQLHQRLFEYAQTHPAVLVDDDKLKSALQYFANHPGPLYNAMKETQKYHQQEKLGFNVPEAEKRRVWDDLLHAYASSPDALRSSSSSEPQSPSYQQVFIFHCDIVHS